MSTPEAPAAPEAGTEAPVTPDPWATALSRYAANVVGLFGIGCLLNALLGQFWEPQEWSDIVFLSLNLGAWSTWLDGAAAKIPHHGRQLAVIAGFALAGAVLMLLVADAAEVDVPAATGVRALVMGIVAIAGSLVISSRLEDEVSAARR